MDSGLEFKVRLCFCLSLNPPSSLQFTPAIRPCLQTIAIGLVAFGENYRRHQSGIGQHHLVCSCTLSSSTHFVVIHRSYSSMPMLLHCSLAPDCVPFDVVCLDCRCSFILLESWGLAGVLLLYLRMLWTCTQLCTEAEIEEHVPSCTHLHHAHIHRYT